MPLLPWCGVQRTQDASGPAHPRTPLPTPPPHPTQTTPPSRPAQFVSALHAMARHMPRADDSLEIMSVRAVDVQLLKENIR